MNLVRLTEERKEGKRPVGWIVFVWSFSLPEFLCRAYGLMWTESPVWMAIISLCWFNCVTDLVAPGQRLQWTIPVQILWGKSVGGVWEGGWEWKLINYLWNWQGLEGGVCNGDFVAGVIRKGSVKFRNDLFSMLWLKHVQLCLAI